MAWIGQEPHGHRELYPLLYYTNHSKALLEITFGGILFEGLGNVPEKIFQVLFEQGIVPKKGG